MRYGVIGTGGIGGYFGGKLARAGHDVHFLFHSDYEYVKQHGLQVNSCRGSFHLDGLNAYSSAADMPQCDVVIVGLKTTNEHLLPALVKPLLNSGTLVLLIQNGIGMEDDVQKMLPGVSIAAGLAFICSTKIAPGVISHEDLGRISIGNYSCTDDSKIERLVDDFNGADIPADEMEYSEARWRKAVWNMPFNGLTVALETRTDTLLSFKPAEQLCRDLMREVVEAASAVGVNGLTMNFAEKMISMTKGMVPYSPSMKVDYDMHRPMEIYYLYTRPIAEARKAGYVMHKMEMLEAELKFRQYSYLKA